MENRKLVEQIRSRLTEAAPLIQVVLGPRQVGKTTALKTALESQGVYRSADSPVPLVADALLEWWELAMRTPKRILAVDEVQKIIGWAEALKMLWDRHRDGDAGLKVILAGSSALVLEKGLKETLAGRFELIRAEHWNYAEADQVFGMSLSDYIQYGCYPGSVQFLDDVQRWGTYVRDAIVEPAIGRDLLQLHPVDSPSLLRQIFGAAVALPAQVVSFQKLQRQLQDSGSIATIQHYLTLLSQAFLVSGIEKYSATPFRRRRSSPKLIVHDNALIRAFERPIDAPLNPERVGRYLENAIGARFIEAGWETYYWKERDAEVDFVVIGPENEHYAIEVKSGRIRPTDFRGLRRFCARHPEFEPRLIGINEDKFAQITSWKIEDVLSLTYR